MKSLHKPVSALLIVAAMSLALSCKESFTEEDALRAQQSIDLALYIINNSDVAQPPVAGAKVTVTQAGGSRVVTTDATGAAVFPSARIGEFIYSVEASGFATVSTTGTLNPTNFRQGQSTLKLGLLSMADADVATVKGSAFAEKDITNGTMEIASVDVTATVALVAPYGTRTFTTKTDANGGYSIKIPVNPAGTSTTVAIAFSDFEADQTYAVNKYSDEAGFFPTVLPRKETQKTTFSLSTAGELNRTLPAANSIRSVFGIAEAAPAGQTTAVISQVFTNSAGAVTGVNFSDGGNYAGDGDGKVTIAITSLDGGSGASIVVTLAANTSVSNAYNGISGGTRVITPGSGYPANTTGITLNRIGTVDPSSRPPFTVLKGSISTANAFYGTGISRPRQIL